jgi:hypothetical protein
MHLFERIPSKPKINFLFFLFCIFLEVRFEQIREQLKLQQPFVSNFMNGWRSKFSLLKYLKTPFAHIFLIIKDLLDN